MGINSQSVRACVWGWKSGRAGRQEGCAGVWTTYVNLSDRYVNKATHNYQGIKCVPCINKIMLRWGRMEWRERKGKKTDKTEEKEENIRHLKRMDWTKINREKRKKDLRNIMYIRSGTWEGKRKEQIRRGGQRRKNSGGRSCLSIKILTTANWKKFTTITTTTTTKVVCCSKRWVSLFAIGQWVSWVSRAELKPEDTSPSEKRWKVGGNKNVSREENVSRGKLELWSSDLNPASGPGTSGGGSLPVPNQPTQPSHKTQRPPWS